MHCPLHRFHHRTLGYHRNPHPPTLPDARIHVGGPCRSWRGRRLRRSLHSSHRPSAIIEGRGRAHAQISRICTAPCFGFIIARLVIIEQTASGRGVRADKCRYGNLLKAVAISTFAALVAPARSFNRLQAADKRPAHYLSASAQNKHRGLRTEPHPPTLPDARIHVGGPCTYYRRKSLSRFRGARWLCGFPSALAPLPSKACWRVVLAFTGIWIHVGGHWGVRAGVLA